MASAIPNAGGVAAFFAGENDMGTFGTQLVAFGSSIKLFSNEVVGINEEAVTAAANAGLLLAEMASAIPNVGGVAGFFAGDNDMATFGTQLVAFGTAMKLFSNEVVGINEEAVTAAASAGTMLSEMASTLPNTGGLVSWFTGDNGMATFGTQLVTFGTAMKSFSEEVSGIDEGAITAAATAGSSLADMAKNLPESGGLWSVFAADNDMSTFAKEIKKFGEGMSDFSEEVAGVDEGAITSTATTATALVTIANNLPSADNIEKLKTFGGNLKTFGQKMKDFADEVADIDGAQLATAISEIGKLGTVDFSGIETLGNSLANIGTDSVNQFISSFQNAGHKLTVAGMTMMAQLKIGIQNGAKSLSTIFNAIITSCLAVINAKYTSFYSAGQNVVTGFARGITMNTYLATARAKAMAQKAYQAAKEALNINSPSKLFRSLGTSVPEGFAIGIGRLGGMVKNSTIGMTDVAIESTKNAIARLADTITSDVDTQPTIRPVLDLSDVAAGANSIGGMFNMSPSVGVMANISAISGSMANRQNGNNNSDVISAIEKLGNKLGNTTGNTYNVNGVTYDDGSNISHAVSDIVRAAKIERRR